MEGKLREMDGRIMQMAEGVVQSDGEITDDILEIDFKLSTTGEEVIVEETIAAGSVFRIPKAGEMALLGFVDGDRNEGYVLGWINRPDSSPAPELDAGTVYIFAREGEDVRIVTDKRVTIDAPETRIGGDSATDPLSLSSKTDANFSKVQANHDAHQHFYVVPLIPIATAPTTPGAPSQIIGPLPKTGAGKAKGE